MATLPDRQEKLFSDRFSPKKWERVRKAMNTPELKFHDLRKTFASLKDIVNPVRLVDSCFFFVSSEDAESVFS